jgi:hypothetical protein
MSAIRDGQIMSRPATTTWQSSTSSAYSVQEVHDADKNLNGPRL